MYQQLEVSFDPLHMGASIAEILSIVNNTDELSFVRHYIKVIEEVAVGKHLRQVRYPSVAKSELNSHFKVSVLVGTSVRFRGD